MTVDPYLAVLSEPGVRSSECLSVFLVEGKTAAECLNDPPIIGEIVAAGHWRLLGVDASRRQAYYARIEHTRAFGCDSSVATAPTSAPPQIF